VRKLGFSRRKHREREGIALLATMPRAKDTKDVVREFDQLLALNK
jgi:hypothetical protein